MRHWANFGARFKPLSCNLTYARGQRAEDILSVRNALGTTEYGEKAMV